MKLSLLKKNKVNHKTKSKLKHTLNISQTEHHLQVAGRFSHGYYHTYELWIMSRDQTKQLKASTIEPTDTFSFDVSLDWLIDALADGMEHTYDWYFKVSIPLEALSDRRKEAEEYELVEREGAPFAEYFIRCGRFQYTDISGLGFYDKGEERIINYITTKGNFSLAVNQEPNSPTRLQIDKVKKQGSVLRLEGKMFTRNALIRSGQISLIGRENKLELSSHSITFHLQQEATKRKYGLKRYIYTAEIDILHMDGYEALEEDIYDLFFKLDLHDSSELKYVRVGRPTLRAKLLLRDLHAKDDQEALVIHPYYTFKKFNLSFELYKFPIENFQYLRKMMRWSWLVRLFNRKNNIWIIGERTYKAQDTGYAFFRYMRMNHPEHQAYYVIDKHSPERKNVEPYGNVLDYKSKEHIKYTILAKKVISSHHPDYLYPIRTGLFKRKVKADKVFLQHGVMGTKNMVANYGKFAPGFDTDLFMVSSSFEKEMIVNDFSYDPQQVFITGLSRFDTLFEQDVPVKRQILIIPTWRDWIVTEESFFESEYYERYKHLIHDPNLKRIAEEYDVNVLFCLHPNMQRFSKYFNNSFVRIINQGEIDVQHLIKESALMITDYSSVAFDFSFLHKPVIYYQFDRARFIGNRPSHIDLNDLPGEICTEQAQILQLVEAYANSGFEMKPIYKEKSHLFIDHRDQSASERIYQVIRDNNVKKRVFGVLLGDPRVKMLYKGIFNKFRRSKYYFPTMKFLYKIGSKIIPVDERMVLFESGIGKQYGDSPKEIYEEMIAQKLDYRKVWVYNHNQRFHDPKTKRIKRLSPQYYYYLLKAGYWVNNQNFPTYLKKRPQTTYLQTWHGTPLKKMLYDIEEVHGRSDGYVERVGNAVKNWDYLVSPSNYATKAFRSAFHYNGEVLEVGYPRNDIFYQPSQEEMKERIRLKLGIPADKKVILYAPTFRDDQKGKKNRFAFELEMDIQQMQERLADDYVLLLRMHVVVSSKLTLETEWEEFAHNVSNYPDMQELLLISDVLITDYSSVMFDFANTSQPMLFFTYDLEHYRDSLRGFYMDLETEAPGPLVYNTEEIVTSIENITQVKQAYEEKYTRFRERFCGLEDGHATKRVVDAVFQPSNGKK